MCVIVRHSVLLLLFCFFGVWSPRLVGETVKIAMVTDGPDRHEAYYLTTIRTEVVELLTPEFDVEFSYFEGNWSTQGVELALEDAYDDPDVTVVVTGGLLASRVALDRATFPKPTVVPIVLDPKRRRWSPSTGGSGIENLTYVRETKTLQADVEALNSLRPIDKLAVIGDASMIELQGAREMKEVEAAAAHFKARAQAIPVKDNAVAAIEALKNSGADAVLLLPTPRLGLEVWKHLVQEITAMGMTSLSVMGEYEVEMGVLATTTPYSYIKRMARRIALNIQEIVLEGSTKDIEVNFPSDYELVINQEVAEALNLALSWDIVSTARFIMEPKATEGEFLTLREAFFIAWKANLDLDAQRDVVRGGCQDVIRARSSLLPQVDGLVEATKIDSDRARAAGGANPETTAIASVRLRQQLYNEESWRDYDVERWLQASRTFDLEATKLDVFFDTAVSYLDVLRLRATERVQRDNYKVSLANLKRARDRVESGEARLSEVYRWESEIASNRRTLLDVQSRLAAAEKQFNRVLNRCLDEPVKIKDITFDNPDYLLVDQVVNDFVTLPDVFSAYKAFVVYLARERSPELLALRRQIGARLRVLKAAERSYYIPSVGATAEMGHRFHRGGAGKKFPAGVSVDDVESAITLDLTYPLWTSHDRSSQVCKARSELRRLQTTFWATQERIDQRVMDSIDDMRASYLSIDLARSGAESARKNLDIVSDSYARGIISIVDLIDAQNAALASDQDSYNAVYDFFTDLMAMQRASGSFDYLEAETHQENYMQRLKQFVESRTGNRESRTCACAG